MAIDYLLGELKHTGGFSTAMAGLGHYFTKFQAFLVAAAEDDRGRFDLRIAWEILRRLAEYLSRAPVPPAVFLYQFEAICRNRLSYDSGLVAMAADPIFDVNWHDWILLVRRQIGIVGLAELLYVRSQHYADQCIRKRGRPISPDRPVLFGEKEGKIAWANRQKEPLLLFAALQRHLDYPVVPRPRPPDATPELVPQLLRRMERLETRMKLLEEEQRGGLDITKFYGEARPEPPSK
jgi:hypothetical protein